jgi:predicted NBD/HSP70 family sugar kinase
MLQPQVEPRIHSPLDPGFVPAILVNREFQRLVKNEGEKAVIGLERGSGDTSRVELTVFPDHHPLSIWNNRYVERIVKFLLWQRGSYKLFFYGSPSITSYLANTFSPRGDRAFDYNFFGQRVYEQEFQVIACKEDEIPPSQEIGKKLGGNINGFRIGFDLGASDRKIAAVVDGEPIYSEETTWEPRKNSDPNYHYQEIMSAIKSAASKLPRIDAIGGSSAGIFINNKPMIASLFRGIPENQYSRVKDIFLRIRDELGVPLEVINDGDVTALAGSMTIKENGILGIALGSSEAAGYVNTEGHVMGWLNELAFAPIDYNPNAPVDEWSGDRGCGATYFSQQCVFRLAPVAGIKIPTNIPDAEKLKVVQEKLEHSEPGAVNIWKTMGVYLGYGLAHYADYYDIRHVLILGRCTSGRGGDLLLDGVQNVFSAEFPDLLQQITLHLPDEKIRRVGQTVAAASLPYLPSPHSQSKDL